MKSCHKGMIICLLGAIAVVFVLPKLGLPVAGTSILIPLLMLGGCVIPMVMMMFTSRSEKLGSCCSPKDDSKASSPGGTEMKTVDDKPSCH